MTTEAEPTLAGVFPPASEQQWLALVDKVLKGAPLDKLRSRTPGGLEVEPLYTRDRSPGSADEAGVPGAEPFVRGAGEPRSDDGSWPIRAAITAADPHEANRVALRELERGAGELTVRFDRAFRSGVSPVDEGFSSLAGGDGVLITSVGDLDAVLDAVLVDIAPVRLQPGAAFTRAAELLTELWHRRGVDPAEVRGSIGADPLGTLATAGTLPQGLDVAMSDLVELAARLAHTHPQVQAIAVDTTAAVEAGASETQELAVMLLTGAAYLRALADSDLDAAAANRSIEVTLSADADVFTTIAKLRAARRVWAQLLAACGAEEASRGMHLHVRTADRMLSTRDPWVNLLRVTAAAFAAGVAGADAVTTASFDSLLGEPEELGRRMARNTQLLLQQESNVGRVADPAGGSWYVETLSDQIATASWQLFVELEAAGGLPGVLLDGSLAAAIGEVREQRLARVATRRDPLTGVSEFADVAEAPVIRSEADLRTLRSRAVNVSDAQPMGFTGPATECEPLPQVRWAQEFEALRDASDAYVAATGTRPKVFLANLGPVAEHTARATYAKNFFAAGGIEAVTSETGSSTGFDDGAAAAADALAAAAHLVCICSSDTRYEQHAADVAAALRDAGLGPVYLAGNPGERRDELTGAGVSEFIHVGVDVLDVLRRAHEHIGTPTGAVRR